MPKTRVRRHRSRKNRTRRGGVGEGVAPPPYVPPASTYVAPAAAADSGSGIGDKLSKAKDSVFGWFSSSGGRCRRKHRGGNGVAPYDPSTINAPYGPYTNKSGGRRRKSRKSRKSRR